MTNNLDLSSVNPGVRELVRRLNESGFNTTDSGDGKTNIESGMECAIPIPHVHIVLKALELARPEGGRLLGLLRNWGLDPEAHQIQLTYSPVDEKTILSLYGFTDEQLR